MKIKARTIVFWVVFALVYVLAVFINSLTDWFNFRFGVTFEEIIFTITSPLDGSDVSFLGEAVAHVLPAVLVAVVAATAVVVFALILQKVLVKISVKIGKKTISFRFYTLYKIGSAVVSVALLVTAVHYSFQSLELGTYISRKLQTTTIYEQYYMNPDDVVITPEGEPKNIIYIYLESMETTYASTDVGGAQDINYIPNLTALAQENVSFSDTDKLGGAYVNTGASWTMGALFSMTTGAPFAFPVGKNTMSNHEIFAPGITAMGEILDDFGYRQVFLCGSAGNFAGRATYFTQHGNYEIKDLDYARQKGYIPEGYYVWWGYEDLKLYDIAKTELLELEKGDEPFNFTMLTVDTHHVDGYVCSNCNSTYDSQLGNVLECADGQILEFIRWCQEQDFYEDTVIVMTGDHLRTDTSLVEGKDGQRRLYNCIINADKEAQSGTTNRIFTSVDMFPTTLSVMGFTIEGDRLGLGTDLFSDTPTLAEELGVDYLNEELGKYSEYYLREFGEAN